MPAQSFRSEIRQYLREARSIVKQPSRHAPEAAQWAWHALLFFGTPEEKQNADQMLNGENSVVRMKAQNLLRGSIHRAVREARTILKDEKHRTIDEILWARQFLQHLEKQKENQGAHESACVTSDEGAKLNVEKPD